MGTLLTISQIFGLIALVTLIWLVIRAFKRSVLWGIAVLLLSPITATIYGILYWDSDKKPFLSYISSFLVSVSLALYVFTAWGGGELARSAFAVQEGIHSETLREQDAIAFMRAGLDFAENSNPGEQEQKKLDFMRKFMDKYEQGMTEADQQELNRELLDLMEGDDLTSRERQQLDELRAQLQLPSGDTAGSEADSEGEVFRKDEWLRGEPAGRRSSMRTKNPRHKYVPIDPKDAGDHIGETFRVRRNNGDAHLMILKGTSPGKLRFERRASGGTIQFNYYLRDITELEMLQWRVAQAPVD